MLFLFTKFWCQYIPMYIASPHAIRLVWSEILFPISTLQILQKFN